MIYESADAWRGAPEKRVLLFGMSGLGKTHVSAMLRREGGWFHYSVDYRIGTRYMGEHIADSVKAEAMKVPYLAALLRTDSIYIGSNITFQNLAPLSTYLGKPGDPDKGGLPFEEYRRRQALHRQAEVASMLDTPYFIDRETALRDREFRLRQFGLSLRGGRPARRGGPGPDGAPRQSSYRLDRRHRGAYPGADRTLRPRPQADVLRRGVSRGGLVGLSRRERRRPRRGRPRRLRPLGLCPGAGAPPAPLPGHRRELGRDGAGRGGRPRRDTRGLHRGRRPRP